MQIITLAYHLVATILVATNQYIWLLSSDVAPGLMQQAHCWAPSLACIRRAKAVAVDLARAQDEEYWYKVKEEKEASERERRKKAAEDARIANAVSKAAKYDDLIANPPTCPPQYYIDARQYHQYNQYVYVSQCSKPDNPHNIDAKKALEEPHFATECENMTRQEVIISAIFVLLIALLVTTIAILCCCCCRRRYASPMTPIIEQCPDSHNLHDMTNEQFPPIPSNDSLHHTAFNASDSQNQPARSESPARTSTPPVPARSTLHNFLPAQGILAPTRPSKHPNRHSDGSDEEDMAPVTEHDLRRFKRRIAPERPLFASPARQTTIVDDPALLHTVQMAIQQKMPPVPPNPLVISHAYRSALSHLAQTQTQTQALEQQPEPNQPEPNQPESTPALSTNDASSISTPSMSSPANSSSALPSPAAPSSALPSPAAPSPAVSSPAVSSPALASPALPPPAVQSPSDDTPAPAPDQTDAAPAETVKPVRRRRKPAANPLVSVDHSRRRRFQSTLPGAQ